MGATIHPSQPRYPYDVFPAQWTSYPVPLSRGPQGSRLSVLFSVDWEKDHGQWRQGLSASYSGIRNGTPALCELLDELTIPCTWFVEANSQFGELDMPRACTPELSQLCLRSDDEIGLHIHWGNFEIQGEPVNLNDRAWVSEEIRASSLRLASQKGSPVYSFRSGGHVLVPSLPAILKEQGYRVDLSVEDRRPSYLRRIQGWLGFASQPYQPAAEWSNQTGSSGILEVPTSLHIHDHRRTATRLSQWLARGRDNVLSIYIHIDEITTPGSGQLDPNRLESLRYFLVYLQSELKATFLTASAWASQCR